MLDRQPVLEGERLILRPLVPADWDALFAVASDPLIWQQHPMHDRWQRPVFDALFDDAMAQRGALAVANGPEQRLRAILAASFTAGNFRREVVGAWLNFYVLAQTVPEAKRLLAIYQGRLRSNLVSALRPIAGARAAGIAEKLGSLIDGL